MADVDTPHIPKFGRSTDVTGARRQVMKDSRKSQHTEGPSRDLQVIQGSKHFPVGLVLTLFSTF